MRRSDPPIDRLILCSNSYHTVGRTRLQQEPQEYFYDIRLPIRHYVDEAFSLIHRSGALFVKAENKITNHLIELLRLFVERHVPASFEESALRALLH